ncbi:MAG: hypothetical protein JNM34_03845 [Chthonomonadaceae bacterium]|nr:hypothetical protein [Chthonomonadaceae bacterium]
MCLVTAADLTAYAGVYTKQYIPPSGSVYVVGPTGGSFSVPYGEGSFGYGGHEWSRDAPGYPVGHGLVDCAGPVTIRFTWSPSYPGDEPPKSAVVTKQALAVWAGDGGSAANGLGDPEETYSEGGQSYGTHYEVKSNPSWQFDITINATAHGSQVGGGPDLCAYAGVWMNVSAVPVECELYGGKTLGGAKHFMIGQGCQAVGIADGFTLSNFSWFIPGMTFKDFVIGPGQQYGHPVYLDGTDYHLDSPHWFWRLPNQTAQPVYFTSQCWAGLTYVGQVTAQRNAKVWAPENPDSDTDSIEDPNYFQNGYPNFTVHLGPYHSDTPPGITLVGHAKTPEFMREGNDWGNVTWGQLTKIDDHSSNRDIDVPNFVLDNEWYYPYASLAMANGEVVSQMEDSPTFPLNGATWFDVNEEFESYLVYIPPGNDVCHVNLMRCWWGWLSNGSRANIFIPFSPDPPSGFRLADHQPWTSHAEWSDVFHNG